MDLVTNDYGVVFSLILNLAVICLIIYSAYKFYDIFRKIYKVLEKINDSLKK